MTISEAHKVWTKIVKGSQVSQEEILEARKTYEETIEEWHKRDDINRETIGDQEMLKVFNDDPKVKEAADKIIKYLLNNEYEDKSNKTNADAFDAARDQQCSKGRQRIDEGWQQLLYCHA